MLDALSRADAPDVVFQFAPCLEADDRRTVIAKLRRALRAADSDQAADPDVRWRCSGAVPILGTETLGIWREPLPPAAYPLFGSARGRLQAAARDRALVPIALLQRRELFAGRIKYPLLRTFANQAWESLPKRLAESGKPDRHGPIRLRTFTFWFTDGNEVKSFVSGDYEQGISVGFDFTATDALSADRGELKVESRRDLDVDQTPLAAITVALAAIFPPLGALGLRWMTLAGNQEEAPPDPGTSVGAMLLQIFPREIMVRGGEKVVFSYSRLQLSPGWAVSAGGTHRLDPRVPRAEITGSRSLWVARSDPPKRVMFRLRSQDLRPPLTVSWTLDGQRLHPVVEDEGPTAQTIAFDVPPNVRDGAEFARRVAVAVTDTDDLRASAAANVRVHVIDPMLAPLCQERPHLPQCERRSDGN